MARNVEKFRSPNFGGIISSDPLFFSARFSEYEYALECSDMSYVEYMKVLMYAIVEGIVECGKTFIYSTYDISERSN